MGSVFLSKSVKVWRIPPAFLQLCLGAWFPARMLVFGAVLCSVWVLEPRRDAAASGTDVDASGALSCCWQGWGMRSTGAACGVEPTGAGEQSEAGRFPAEGICYSAASNHWAIECGRTTEGGTALHRWAEPRGEGRRHLLGLRLGQGQQVFPFNIFNTFLTLLQNTPTKWLSVGFSYFVDYKYDQEAERS